MPCPWNIQSTARLPSESLLILVRFVIKVNIHVVQPDSHSLPSELVFFLHHRWDGRSAWPAKHHPFSLSDCWAGGYGFGDRGCVLGSLRYKSCECVLSMIRTDHAFTSHSPLSENFPNFWSAQCTASCILGTHLADRQRIPDIRTQSPGTYSRWPRSSKTDAMPGWSTELLVVLRQCPRH